MSLQAQLDAYVESCFDAQVAFLREIVRVPSYTPPGDNAPAAEKAASLLEALGATVERHRVPDARAHELGLRSVVNLVVRHRFGAGGPTIALNAHGDVVPPGDGWTKPPYEGAIADGRMYGRGVAVSKSDIATYAYALEALKEAARHGASLRGTVELHFTYDEELGGLAGPGWLLEHGITKPDYAIAASFSYAIVTAHNGALQLEVVVHGKAAHGAMPKTGVDALRAANAMIAALYAEADRLERTKSAVAGIDSPTLIVGRIEGGINTNVVPDRVMFRLDRRMIPEEDPAAVEARVRALIEDAAKAHAGARVEIRRLLLANALMPRPGHEKLVAALRRHAERVFGEPIPALGVPLYADARLYGEHGIPTVMYGAGPRTILEANAKRADENLTLDDLKRATKVVANAVADLLGGNASG
jgi:acetylornithine deacetylase/succinyl-diaminopimelate desuccinylase-like protein